MPPGHVGDADVEGVVFLLLSRWRLLDAGLAWAPLESFHEGSSTAHRDPVGFLRVQVDEHLRLDPGRVEASCACHAILFVGGQQHLERARNRLVHQNRQSCGDADTVVSPKGRAVSREPAVVHVRLDGVAVEVEGLATVGDGDDVHVRLEADPLRVGLRGGVPADQHVARLVNAVPPAVLLSQVTHEVLHGVLPERRAGDLEQAEQQREHVVVGQHRG
mmetsp:Transcript_28103/g.54780  ORF Transcript_28103/g.54780 Transcript_28103/m.54780 type:complete len:218 (-) Transcript_28103:44-697(-)